MPTSGGQFRDVAGMLQLGHDSTVRLARALGARSEAGTLKFPPLSEMPLLAFTVVNARFRPVQVNNLLGELYIEVEYDATQVAFIDLVRHGEG